MIDAVQWSWGDASLASSANPFSTSSKKGAKDTVAELQEHKAKGSDRPVVLHVKDSAGKLQKEQFGDVGTAMQALQLRVVAEENSLHVTNIKGLLSRLSEALAGLQTTLDEAAAVVEGGEAPVNDTTATMEEAARTVSEASQLMADLQAIVNEMQKVLDGMPADTLTGDQALLQKTLADAISTLADAQQVVDDAKKLVNDLKPPS
eukprot:CAMPEP_0194503982 /NCGR_PEP_ID=MMETSP0253-20130528/28689_1 /TAXON_ID=2966 /ORGANISM="Noctiluca scintillans" /LENGTH=204 /DNA_ID=CAMNT_0039346323 /DNA_START=23 /DNA_END=634 /DNA_ORIENTATION=+